MSNRTIMQQGQAFGNTTCMVTASIDGTQVYSGAVSTLDEPLPPQPGYNIENNLFSWTIPTGFTGTQTMTIAVAGSPLWLADSCGDWTFQGNVLQINSLDTPQTIDGVTVADPLTNVTIDGVAKTRLSSPTGQWYWLINAGSTFTATISINISFDYPDWDPTTTYAPLSNVVYQNACYRSSGSGAPVGLTPNSSTQYWVPLPIPPWSIDSAYAQWNRVTYLGNIFIAAQNVPAGIDISNTSYWTPTHT